MAEGSSYSEDCPVHRVPNGAGAYRLQPADETEIPRLQAMVLGTHPPAGCPVMQANGSNAAQGPPRQARGSALGQGLLVNPASAAAPGHCPWPLLTETTLCPPDTGREAALIYFLCLRM